MYLLIASTRFLLGCDVDSGKVVVADATLREGDAGVRALGDALAVSGFAVTRP
jgi:hypothetical protein